MDWESYLLCELHAFKACILTDDPGCLIAVGIFLWNTDAADNADCQSFEELGCRGLCELLRYLKNFSFKGF